VLPDGALHGEAGAGGADFAGLTRGLALDHADVVDAGLTVVAAEIAAGLELTDAEVLCAAELVVPLAVTAGNEGPAVVRDEAAGAVAALRGIVTDRDAEEDRVRGTGLLDAGHVLRAVRVVLADLRADLGIGVEAGGAVVAGVLLVAGGPDGALGHAEVLQTEVTGTAESAVLDATLWNPTRNTLHARAGIDLVGVDLERILWRRNVRVTAGVPTGRNINLRPGDIDDGVGVGRGGVDGVSSVRTTQGEEPEAQEENDRKRWEADSLHG